MNSLIVRADAGSQIGNGHLMRCLALAQAWHAEGGRAIFLSHCESQAVRSGIEAAGFGFVPLEKPHPDPSDFRCSVALIKEVEAEWLVLDGYQFGPTFQKALRDMGQRLLFVDDTAHQPEYHANVLLNQNINSDRLAYRCDPDTKILLGPSFALLRSEFGAWYAWSREIPRIAKRVIVTLGGGDPDNVTLKVIRALDRIEIEGLEAVAVIGGSNPHLEELRHVAENASTGIRIEYNAKNMPALMSWADVAISGAGSTCWELAFMALPSLIIITADNQVGIAEGLSEAGSVINLGWFDRLPEQEISRSLLELLLAYDLRAQMSAAGRALVDGRGAARVTATMLGQ